MTTPLPTWLSRALNAIGIVVVAASVYRATPVVPPWLFALVAVSLVSWGVIAVLRDRTPFAVFVVSVVAGGLATVPTQAVVLVPVIVAVIVVAGYPARPPWQAVIVVLLGFATVPIGLAFATMGPFALASIECGIAVAAFGGFSRRQSRRSVERERELFEQRATAAALAERQAVARDIHDVLAHSLGGLVLQLDAIDAQLEAGKVADAAERVRQARELAASGLSEARKAVDALRDERGVVSAIEVSRSLDELVDAHRMLGGSADFFVVGDARDLPADRADSLRRALQESLTNARKHAPGQPVDIVLSWFDGVSLDVSNPMGDQTARSGGHGLQGMTERFERFGEATAAEIDGRFVVHARVDA